MSHERSGGEHCEPDNQRQKSRQSRTQTKKEAAQADGRTYAKL